MMSIAIMGNAGGPSSGPARDTSRSAKPWGTARLGQSVLLVELIAQVQSMRRAREYSTVSLDLICCEWLLTSLERVRRRIVRSWQWRNSLYL